MSYRGWTALQGLSFALQPGHVMGFLGPNGAGKTTSIRILTTILRPTSGRYSVDGITSDRPAQIRPRIGVLPETLGLPNQITGIEYITYFARLYGRRGDDARSHGLAMLEMVGLRERGRSLIRAYSHGMRQRLGIARALVNDPVVLFLDEPTLGLDPRGQQSCSRSCEISPMNGAPASSSAATRCPRSRGCATTSILSSGHVVATGLARFSRRPDARAEPDRPATPRAGGVGREGHRALGGAARRGRGEPREQRSAGSGTRRCSRRAGRRRSPVDEPGPRCPGRRRRPGAELRGRGQPPAGRVHGAHGGGALMTITEAVGDDRHPVERRATVARGGSCSSRRSLNSGSEAGRSTYSSSTASCWGS